MTTRRRLLCSTGFATVGLAGCMGSDESGADSDEEGSSCATEYPISYFTTEIVENRAGPIEMTVKPAVVSPGDEITFRSRNVSDEKVTGVGSSYTYGFQRRRDGEWVDLSYYESQDRSTEATAHEPGEGYEWTFTVSEESFGRQQRFCGEIEPGTYRFVAEGSSPSPAVTFEIE